MCMYSFISLSPSNHVPHTSHPCLLVPPSASLLPLALHDRKGRLLFQQGEEMQPLVDKGRRRVQVREAQKEIVSDRAREEDCILRVGGRVGGWVGR